NPQEAFFTIKPTAGGYVLGGTLLTFDGTALIAGEVLFERTGENLSNCTALETEANFAMADGGTHTVLLFVSWSNFTPTLATVSGTPVATTLNATELCTPPPGGNCAAPINLVVMNVRSTTAPVRWRPARGASGYELSYRVSPNGSWTTLTVWGVVRRITGLQAGKTYQWRVRAVCATGGFSAYANGPNFSTPACDPPNAPTVSDVAFTTAKVSWTLEGNQHKIRYRPVGSSTWTEVQANGANASPCTLTGLTPGTEYEVAVSRRCPPPGNHWSEWSGTTQFSTPGCYKPYNVKAYAVTSSSVRVEWRGFEGYTGYQVRYRPQGNPNWTTVGTTDTTRLLVGLNPALLYEMQVRSRCDLASNSEWTETRIVASGARAPVVHNETIRYTFFDTLGYDVLLNDYDLNGQSVFISTINPPRVIEGDANVYFYGSLVYVLPNAGYQGYVIVEYNVSDGSLESSGYLTMQIEVANTVSCASNQCIIGHNLVMDPLIEIPLCGTHLPRQEYLPNYCESEVGAEPDSPVSYFITDDASTIPGNI
ncbi:MAG: fibronectin type III domain-containing protein, partial [Bacteroidia bacterium]|nr:fibronectin type III domain-containing protein [Bacteroidia bacterium]